MQSKRAVLNALESDKSRLPGGRVHTGLKVGSAPLRADLDDSSDDEWINDGSGKRSVAKSYRVASLQRAGRRLSLVRAICSKQALPSRGSLATRYEGKVTPSLEGFVAQVLNSSSLMRKSLELQRKFHEPLLGPMGKEAEGAAPLDGKYILSQVMQTMHKLKVYTAHACWYDHVEPAREQVQDVQAKHSELWAQFRDARHSFLKEVSMLRDELHASRYASKAIASDLQAQCASADKADISFYFDVESLMSEEEKKFLLDACTEKLKMIMQRNPQLKQGCDLSQLDRLHCKIEKQEIRDLRKELKRVGDELNAQTKNGSRRSSMDVHTARDHKMEEMSKRIVNALEHQVDELQTQLWSEKKAHKECQERSRHLESERDDLAHGLREEVNRRFLFQEEGNRLRCQIDTLEQQLQAAARSNNLLQKQLQVQEEQVKRLEHALNQPKPSRKSKCPRPKPAPEKPTVSALAPVTHKFTTGDSRRTSRRSVRKDPLEQLVANRSQPSSGEPTRPGSAQANLQVSPTQASPPSQPEEATKEVGPGSAVPEEIASTPAAAFAGDTSAVADGDADAGASSPEMPDRTGHGHADETIEQYEAWVREANTTARIACLARDELLRANASLQAQCQHLSELLSQHVDVLVALEPEESATEAANLNDIVIALGCTTGSNVRACTCGALFHNESEAFCARCGLQQPPRDDDTGHPVEDLARDLHTLEMEHARAVTQLHDALKRREDENQSSVQHPHSAIEMVNLRQQAEEFRHQRDLTEAQILVKHVHNTFHKKRSKLNMRDFSDDPGTEPLEDDDYERRFVVKLQSLCAGLASKLVSSALDATSLSKALGQVQVALRKGTEAFQECQPEEATVVSDARHQETLCAVQEAQKHASISMSHHQYSGSRFKRERKARIQQLLEKTSRVLHMVASAQPMPVQSILHDVGRTAAIELTPENTPEVKQLPPLQDLKRVPMLDEKPAMLNKKALPPLSRASAPADSKHIGPPQPKHRRTSSRSPDASKGKSPVLSREGSPGR